MRVVCITLTEGIKSSRLSTPSPITKKVSQQDKSRVHNLIGLSITHSSILQLRTIHGWFTSTISRTVQWQYRMLKLRKRYGKKKLHHLKARPLGKTECSGQESSEYPCRIDKFLQGNLPHMRHHFVNKIPLLLPLSQKIYFKAVNNLENHTVQQNIQSLQRGIPVLPTSWNMHHHSACRRQVWASEDPNRVPTRGTTNKSVRRKWIYPCHKEENQGG